MAVMTVFHNFSKSLAVKCGLLVILGSSVGGCASATIDNAVPGSDQANMPTSTQPAAIAMEKPVPPRSGTPINTGAYPNINVVPQGQTDQLSDADSANLRDTLYAEQASQRQPGEPVAAYIARLRKLQSLGSTHAAAVLKQIEASQ